MEIEIEKNDKNDKKNDKNDKKNEKNIEKNDKNHEKLHENDNESVNEMKNNENYNENINELNETMNNNNNINDLTIDNSNKIQMLFCYTNNDLVQGTYIDCLSIYLSGCLAGWLAGSTFPDMICYDMLCYDMYDNTLLFTPNISSDICYVLLCLYDRS